MDTGFGNQNAEEGFSKRYLIFFYDDGPRSALPCGLTDFIFQPLWNYVHQDPRHKLVFIILKYLGANLIAIAVSHTKVIINFCFHKDSKAPTPSLDCREGIGAYNVFQIKRLRFRVWPPCQTGPSPWPYRYRGPFSSHQCVQSSYGPSHRGQP